MATIKNLAFKGGGVLGIAYAGAIKVLEDHNLLQTVERVAGTSAGAATALLVSLGYNSGEIKQMVNGTSFKSFEDRENPFRIMTTYGLYAGDSLLDWLQGFMAPKGLSKTATFSDLHAHGCKDLIVFALDLNLQTVREFSFAMTPNVVVAEAVRASMSIPLFFKAWSFSNNNPDNHIYVDGGTVYNYPITIFDTDGEINPDTMGFYLSNVHAVPKSNDLGFDHIVKYVKVLFESMMDAQDIDMHFDSEILKYTAIIDNLGISATDFDLTTAQEEALYQSGITCTTNYLSNKI